MVAPTFSNGLRGFSTGWICGGSCGAGPEGKGVVFATSTFGGSIKGGGEGDGAAAGTWMGAEACATAVRGARSAIETSGDTLPTFASFCVICGGFGRTGASSRVAFLALKMRAPTLSGWNDEPIGM